MSPQKIKSLSLLALLCCLAALAAPGFWLFTRQALTDFNNARTELSAIPLLQGLADSMKGAGEELNNGRGKRLPDLEKLVDLSRAWAGEAKSDGEGRGLATDAELAPMAALATRLLPQRALTLGELAFLESSRGFHSPRAAFLRQSLDENAPEESRLLALALAGRDDNGARGLRLQDQERQERLLDYHLGQPQRLASLAPEENLFWQLCLQDLNQGLQVRLAAQRRHAHLQLAGLLGLFILILAAAAWLIKRIPGPESDEALRKSEARFRALLEDSSEAMVLMSPEGRVLFASESVTKVTGYTPEERTGSHSNTILHPEDREEVWRVFNQAVKDPSRTYTFESRLLHKNGHYIHTSARLRNFLNDPNVGALVLNYRDSTVEHEARRALARSEALFKALVETSFEANLLLNEKGQIIRYLGKVESIAGYTAEERQGRNAVTPIHPDDQPKMQALLADAVAHKGVLYNVEFRAKAKDGTWQWVESTVVNRLDDPAIGAIVATHRNITQRRATEDALRQSEEFYRALIENTSDIVLIYRSDRSVSYENPAAVQALLGYAPAELEGFGAFDLVHPDDLAAVLRRTESFQQGPAQLQPIELRLKAKDGSWRTFDSRGINLGGNPVVGGLLVQLRDISDSREAQKRLLRFERLAAIGQTVAGLAHELRNPLAVISTCAQFLKMQLSDKPVLHQDLDSILRQVERLKDLINEVLEQSRSEDLNLSLAGADDLFEASLKAAQLRFGQAAQRIEIRRDFGSPAPKLRADMAQMERVIQNLCLNAFQALGAGGALTLRARGEGGQVLLEVADNGPGIPEDKLAKIFEPFYTTKETGSGLGLWICKSIVEQHGGSLEAANLKPRGSLFRILMPAEKEA
jgi:PAS domain S-box-containing protein